MRVNSLGNERREGEEAAVQYRQALVESIDFPEVKRISKSPQDSQSHQEANGTDSMQKESADRKQSNRVKHHKPRKLSSLKANGKRLLSKSR